MFTSFLKNLITNISLIFDNSCKQLFTIAPRNSHSEVFLKMAFLNTKKIPEKYQFILQYSWRLQAKNKILDSYFSRILLKLQAFVLYMFIIQKQQFPRTYLSGYFRFICKYNSNFGTVPSTKYYTDNTIQTPLVNGQ